MKRQIVFIMTDTQRHDMLGCYGDEAMMTPHLDELASEGVRFDKAYTTQPVCSPARAALFTGQFPHGNAGWTNSTALAANVKTLGQRLSDNGIRTAYIGKWHLDGGDYFGLGVCPEGWDPEYWYDIRNYMEELSPADRKASRNPASMESRDFEDDFCFAHRCSDRALSFLETHKGDDFFLTVSYDEPHHPFLSPRRFRDMHDGHVWADRDNFRDNLEKKPDYQKAWAGTQLDEDRSGFHIEPKDFLACNSFVDFEAGRVLEAVKKHTPGAMVVFTSDHGDFLGSHRLSGKGPAFYEEITHVPFIVKWPGRIRPGTVSDHLMSHIDFTPTVLDFMGLPVPELLDGRSILHELKHPEFRTNELVFTEFGRYEVDHDGFGGFQPMRACTDGRFKLSVNLLSGDELYDLNNDPGELENLIDSAKHRGIRNTLHDGILEWMNATRDPFRGYYWERRPWRVDAAEASWDYSGMTRQRENEEYEPRQLDYDTGLEMTKAVRKKNLS